MMEKIDGFLKQNPFLRDLYDVIRIIDPVANREVNNLVITDELTGVYNRRFINEQLPVALQSSKLNSKPMTVMMLDINHFKSINDKYGHLAGDVILSEIAALLKNRIVEDIGWVARYGGDEFFILLNDTGTDTAFKISRYIRKRVCETIFVYDGNEINVSVSIGVYTCDNKQLTPEEVINQVDKKLYMEKEEGRNIPQI